MAVTYDPATLGTGAALSNGNLTVGHSNNTDTGAKSTISKQTAKWYHEGRLNHPSGGQGDGGVGWCNQSASLTVLGGNVTNGAICFLSGNIYINNVNVGTVGTSIGGVWVAVAHDLTAKLIWFKLLPSGLWNNSGTADPATGVGGFSTSSIVSGSNDQFICGLVSQNVDTTDVNFGGSTFVGTMPTGFSSFDSLQPNGTLAAIDGQDVAAMTGGMVGYGTLATVDGQDTLHFERGIVTGTMAAGDGHDVVAFTGPVDNIGALHAIEAADLVTIAAAHYRHRQTMFFITN